MMHWRGVEPLILASKSMARQAILRSCGIEFETMPVDFDERAFEKNNVSLKAETLASALAEAKAQKASEKVPNRLILAADQILLLDGKCLHQCANKKEAQQHLQYMSGKTHYLISAAVLLDEKGQTYFWQEKAEMQMRSLSDGEIENYLDLEGPSVLKSVGCYHYESHGRILFTQVNGSEPVIMGLPIEGLKRHLIDKGYLGS